MRTVKITFCNVCACKKYKANKRTFPTSCRDCGHLVYSHERQEAGPKVSAKPEPAPVKQQEGCPSVAGSSQEPMTCEKEAGHKGLHTSHAWGYQCGYHWGN